MFKFPFPGVWDPLVGESRLPDPRTTAHLNNCLHPLQVGPLRPLPEGPIGSYTCTSNQGSTQSAVCLLHFVKQFPACREHFRTRVSVIGDFDHLLKSSR